MLWPSRVYPDSVTLVEGWVMATLVVLCVGSGAFWQDLVAGCGPEVALRAAIVWVPVVPFRLRLVPRAVGVGDVRIQPPEVFSWRAYRRNRSTQLSEHSQPHCSHRSELFFSGALTKRPQAYCHPSSSASALKCRIVCPRPTTRRVVCGSPANGSCTYPSPEAVCSPMPVARQGACSAERRCRQHWRLSVRTRTPPTTRC